MTRKKAEQVRVRTQALARALVENDCLQNDKNTTKEEKTLSALRTSRLLDTCDILTHENVAMRADGSELPRKSAKSKTLQVLEASLTQLD